jgi:putative glycosyltransferase (TIGR04372 family)
MSLNLNVSTLLDYIKQYSEENNYAAMLLHTNLLLAKDPYNGEYLLYKLKALEGLGQETSDIKFLQLYVNMRSTDVTGFLLLYKAYIKKDDVVSAILSLAYALSLNPNDDVAISLLLDLLQDINPNFKQVKINVMTTNRIGHLSCEIEPLFRSLQGMEHDCLYLFLCSDGPVANQYLFDLLNNLAHIVDDKFWFNLYGTRATLLDDYFYAEYPYDLNLCLRGVSTDDITIYGNLNLNNIYSEFPSFLKLPDQNIELGWQLLSKYNLFKEDKIVCLHLRDSAYLAELAPGADYSYHDYRDAKISSYKLAIQYLIEQGYKVVRIGNGSNQVLDLKSNNYVDLCVNHDKQYGDFFEVLLLSCCDFFIGTTSGPMTLAAIFDTPTLVVNSAPCHHPYFKHARFIPKRLFKNNIEVNLMELHRGAKLSDDNSKLLIMCTDNRELIQNGYEYLDNNENDIYLAIVEFSNQVFNRELVGDFTPLQQQYMEILPENAIFKTFEKPVCNSFLAKYPEIFK